MRQPFGPRAICALNKLANAGAEPEERYRRVCQFSGPRPRHGQCSGEPRAEPIDLSGEVHVFYAQGKSFRDFRIVTALECALVARYRFIQVSQLSQQIAQVFVRCSVMWPKGNRGTIAGDGSSIFPSPLSVLPRLLQASGNSGRLTSAAR